MFDPEKIIKKLKMLPHPEGGYFAESFRDNENNVSLIYYLLKKNQRSHWHRLTKNEILILLNQFLVSKVEKSNIFDLEI